MQAIQILRYGDAGQMALNDVAMPSCGANDVLVHVMFAGVNPVDWKLRSGFLAAMVPKAFPFTLGQDGAGVVVAVGSAVNRFKVGDEVCFYAEFGRGGTYADYVSVAADQVALKPANVSFATAAALPTPGQAAWTAVIEAAQVQAGMNVLIHGGAGALGSLAIQLAKQAGAHVSTTASGAGIALVTSLGADVVIDYRQQDFSQSVRNQDVVIDTIGGATQEASWACLKPGGLLVATTTPPAPDRAAAAGVRATFLYTPPRGDVLANILDRVAHGLRVQPGREFPLADAALAHQLGESGQAGGKMILRVATTA